MLFDGREWTSMDAFVFLSHRKPATGRTSERGSESVDLLTHIKAQSPHPLLRS